MNIPKEYILQCEKAKEIQKEAPLMVGNRYAYLRRKHNEYWILDKEAPIVEIIQRSRSDCNPTHLFEDSIERCWLPRQDELQEMVKPKGLNCAFNYIGGLSRFIDKKRIYSCGFITLDQLWLAFVMFERYSKQWSGKDWVVIKGGK